MKTEEAHRSRRGVILVTTLFVVLIVIMLVVAAVKLSSGSLRAVSQLDERELALWAANSGLEYAQTRLQADFSWQGGLGDGDQVVIDQAGILSVREDNGNVIGVLHRSDGGFAQFLIRFNPQDGTDDPNYIVKNPFISINNLARDTANPVFLGNGSGWSQTTDSNHECPARTAAIIVEGRAGAGIRADLNNPDPPSGSPISRVAEAYFSPDGSDVLNGLMFGGASIDFNSDGPVVKGKGKGKGAGGAKVRLSSNDDAAPRMQTGEGVSADSGTGSIEAKGKVQGRVSVDQSGGFDLLATTNNITVENNNGNLQFPEILWDTLPHADGSETQIPSGIYMWRKDAGNKGLYYYDADYTQYVDGLWPLPAVAASDRVDESFTGLTGPSGDGLSYDAAAGQITLSKDVLVQPSLNSTTFALISEDDGNAERTMRFAPPDGESAVLTNQSGGVVVDATVKGTGGSITSAGVIELTGAGYDLLVEPDAETGISLYAKGDIFLQTFEAPEDTAKGTTKGKNGKGHHEVKGGVTGQFNDMKLSGVIYTWGDFTADLGGQAKLEMKGALIAYGSDPSVGPPVPGQGFITMNAREMELQYDSRYLDSMLQSTSGELKRTMWVVY